MTNLSNGITAMDMSVMQVKELLAGQLADPVNSVPLFLWGAFGVGKSAAPKQVSIENHVGLVDFRALLHDLVDLIGLPHIQVINGESITAWASPKFLPRSGQGIFFLDEVLLSDKAMQGLLFGLVLDRVLGDYRLPDGWVLCAASNRMSDRAGVQAMAYPLRNRFTHLHVAPDMASWCAWALTAGIRPEVIAFLRFRPELLFSVDMAKNDYAFATPRSWEMVSKWMGANLSPANEFGVYSGTVGEGCAAEFLGFLKVFRKMINPDLCLLNPQTADIPDPKEPGVMYALVTALAHRANSTNVDRVLAYGARLPKEFETLLVKDMTGRDKSLTNTAAFIRWAASSSSTLLVN